MAEHRKPEDGEIQIVVLLGADTFIAWAPAADVDGLMDSFERRTGIGEADRTSREAHAGIRIEIARKLRGPRAEELFTDVLAAGCLWLALRHWSGSKDIREGLARQIEATGSAVVTASIADPAPEGSMADTAWAFMVGDRTHDGRDRLAVLGPEQVETIRP